MCSFYFSIFSIATSSSISSMFTLDPLVYFLISMTMVLFKLPYPLLAYFSYIENYYCVNRISKFLIAHMARWDYSFSLKGVSFLYHNMTLVYSNITYSPWEDPHISTRLQCPCWSTPSLMFSI